MNTEYKSLLPADFSPDSWVWIYQSNRLFSFTEALQIEDLLSDFVETWQSHGNPVKGFATVFFGQFIVLMADESASGVSGCSTDSSVRLIKTIEQQFGVQLFDRLLLAFLVRNRVQLLPLQQLNYSVENGFISPDTLYFNNLVATKQELEDNWMIPVSGSWLKTRVVFPENTHSSENRSASQTKR